MVNELAEDVLAINPSIAVTLRVGDHVPCPSRRKNNDLPGLVRKVPPLRSADILSNTEDDVVLLELCVCAHRLVVASHS